MLSSLLILLILPYVGLSETRSSSFRLLRRKLFWLFVLNFLILGWIGGCAPESPYLEIGQVATAFYFAYFIIITPALGVIEKMLLTYRV